MQIFAYQLPLCLLLVASLARRCVAGVSTHICFLYVVVLSFSSIALVSVVSVRASWLLVVSGLFMSTSEPWREWGCWPR